MIPLVLVLLPLVTAAALWLFPSYRGLSFRRMSSAGAGATFLLSLSALVRLKTADGASSKTWAWHQVNVEWMGSLGLRFDLALDGLSGALAVLASAVFLSAVLAACEPRTRKRREQLTGLLLSLSGTMCALLARNAVLALWGWTLAWAPIAAATAIASTDTAAIKATRRMVVHLVTATVLILGCVVALSVSHRSQTGHWTFDLTRLALEGTGGTFGPWLLIPLLLGLGSAAALFPAHTWLPPLLSVAPGPLATALSGAVTKIGLLFMVRMGLMLTPVAHTTAANVLAILCVVGIAHAGFLAWTYRTNLRSLLAYSTIGIHGTAFLGLLSMDVRGVNGAMILLMAGGLSSAALWLGITGLDEKLPGWKPGSPGGLAFKMPRLMVLCMLATACLVGVPGLAGFVGQILIFTGSFDAYTTFAHQSAQWGQSVPLLLAHPKLFTLIAVIAGLSVPAALLVAFHRTFLSPATLPAERKVEDAGGQLFVGMLIPAVFCVLLGLLPNWLLRKMEPSTRNLLKLTTQNYIRTQARTHNRHASKRAGRASKDPIRKVRVALRRGAQ